MAGLVSWRMTSSPSTFLDRGGNRSESLEAWWGAGTTSPLLGRGRPLHLCLTLPAGVANLSYGVVAAAAAAVAGSPVSGHLFAFEAVVNEVHY